MLSWGFVSRDWIIAGLMRSTLTEAFSPAHKDAVSCGFSAV